MGGRTVLVGVLSACVLGPNLWAASPLTESRFTQVINEVKVVQMPAQSAAPARVEEWVRAPDRIRTGADSMAELEAVDRTLTRIGANTIFSFGQDRSMHLQRGSILFHSPKGKGGGKIQSGGASASVLGTTIVVSATEDGGFKTIVLEGKAQVRLPNGDFRVLNAGQLAFVLPGSKKFGPVLTINLGKLVNGSGLVNEFSRQLSSMPRIQEAVLRQDRLLKTGQAVDTGMHVGRLATENSVEVVDTAIVERLLEKKESLEHAVTQDAEVGGAALPEDHMFTVDKAGLPNSGETGLAGMIAARKLTLRPSTIDISPYMDGVPDELIFHGQDTLSVKGSVDFVGNGREDFTLTLRGQKRLKIRSKARLTAQGVGDLSLRTQGDLDLKEVQLRNTTGGIDIQSARRLELDRSGVNAAQGIDARASEIRLKSSTLRGMPEHVALTATEGDLDVDSSVVSGSARTELVGARDVEVRHNSRLVGSMLVIDAGRDVRLENSTLVSSRLAAAAGGTLSAKNLSFLGLSTVSLEARTLVLEDIAFPLGSTVQLRSELGRLAPDPNTGQSAVAGHVNFIRNVTYGGTPAQHSVGGAIQISTR